MCCKEDNEIQAILGSHISGATGLIPFKFDTQVNKTVGHVRCDFNKNWLSSFCAMKG